MSKVKAGGVRRATALGLAAALALLGASQPWRRKNSRQWSQEEANQVLSQSPWAQAAGATFPDTREDPPASVYSLPGAAQAGMAGPKGATDGRWDGGVAKNTGVGMLPILSVLVRWDSALPVRQAWLRSAELGQLQTDEERTSASREPKSYLLSISGLVPAKQYAQAAALPTKSSSESLEGTRPPLDTEHVLEGLMANTKLAIKGKEILTPEDVKLDAATGTIRVYFSRAIPIQKTDKEVLFTTRFGSLSVTKRFRLGDMTYQGRLEL